jgi:hypothetical protein
MSEHPNGFTCEDAEDRISDLEERAEKAGRDRDYWKERWESRTALKLGFVDENNFLTEKGWEHFRKQTAGTGMVLLSKEEAEQVEKVREALERIEKGCGWWTPFETQKIARAALTSGGQFE